MKLKMKLTLLGATLGLAIASLPSFAQGNLKLTPFAGYTLQDKVYGYYGDAVIEDGMHYGASLTYEKSSNVAVDLLYSYQTTTFSIRDVYNIGSNNGSGNYSGSVSYLMLGSKHSPDFNAKLSPYGGLMIGAAIFKSTVTSEDWKFAVGMRLGAVYHINEKFGIMIQTQLMVPVQGVGVYFGTGGTGASTTSSATQLGFTGGLEIKLR
jgi:opacity protein-like surface antigen